MFLASEQRILGVASLGNNCLSSELILMRVYEHALGTASQLTPEPGLRQSHHRLSLGFYGRKRMVYRVSGKRMWPKRGPQLTAWGLRWLTAMCHHG